ncbi:hypothetical protein SAMN05519103_04823 [Rhizobiales bacterium GAS113]|nr:hypothetical protein SAMN05519103_04823 [Rhizobiales bacterium GAS113]
MRRTCGGTRVRDKDWKGRHQFFWSRAPLSDANVVQRPYTRRLHNELLCARFGRGVTYRRAEYRVGVSVRKRRRKETAR